MGRLLLNVAGVSKRYCRRPELSLRYALGDIGRELLCRAPQPVLRPGEFWALQGIDFQVHAGEVVGLIGHNGAGKSTLLNLISGIMLPTTGSIELHTRKVALIDASGGLSPVETGRENAATQFALHGIPAQRIPQELEAVAAFAEIGDFLDAPAGTYSLGMRLRLAFSIYTRLQPELFIIDEALGGGDIRFAARFRRYLRDYVDGGGTILLCSHEMLAIQAFCSRVILLDQGRIAGAGDPPNVIAAYLLMGGESEPETAVRSVLPPQLGQPAAEAARSESRAADSVVIEEVVIRTVDGGELRPGTAVEIGVTCRVEEPIAEVCCAIEIGSGSLIAIATLPGGYVGEAFELLPPRTTFHCRIDRLPLAPGSYDLRVVIVERRFFCPLAMRGYEDLAIHFEVVASPTPLANVARERQNLIDMPTSWRCSPDAQPPSADT